MRGVIRGTRVGRVKVKFQDTDYISHPSAKPVLGSKPSAFADMR